MKKITIHSPTPWNPTIEEWVKFTKYNTLNSEIEVSIEYNDGTIDKRKFSDWRKLYFKS